MKITFTDFDEKYLNDLARIHRISFKDHFNARLGDAYAKAFIRWFGTDKEYNNIFFCAVDAESGELIGYMCGALDGYAAKMNKDLFGTIVLSFLLRPWLVFDKRFFELFTPKIRSLLGKKEYSKFSEFEENLPQPVFSVTAFALEPKFREAGFGIFLLEKLFDEFFRRAKEKNAGTIRATIRSFNKEIFNYYKLKKWEAAPFTEKDKTICFYKRMNG